MQLSPESVKNNLFSVISDMAAAPWLFSTQKAAFSRKRKIYFTDKILFHDFTDSFNLDKTLKG